MSLTPSATVTLGNLRYDSHPSSIVATLGPLPGCNAFQVTLPARVAIDAAVGDLGVLECNNGDGAQLVVTGKVRAFRRGLLDTVVSVADAGADLGAFRPAATYERQNAKNVIQALAAEAGVTVAQLDLDLPLAAYVAHQHRTAAEHIAELARLGGATALVNGEGELHTVALSQDRPEIALLYGRELLAYEVRERPGPQVRRVAVGNGPAGSADAPDALRQSRDMLPNGATAAGVQAIWRAVPILRTPSATLAASQAMERAAAANSRHVRATCFLLPALRPGTILDIQQLPNGLSEGPWRLTQVTHRLHPDWGGSTTFEGQSAGLEAGLGSLLQAGLAAAGGLL